MPSAELQHSLISAIHSKCCAAFSNLLDATTQSKHLGQQINLSDVHGFFDRYRLWAGNVGAGHSGKTYVISLDYRLRNSPTLSRQIDTLLTRLIKNIEDLSDLLRGRRTPFEEQVLLDGEEQYLDSADHDDDEDDSSWGMSSNESYDPSYTRNRSNYQEPHSMQQMEADNLVSGLNSEPLGYLPKKEIPYLLKSIGFVLDYLYRIPIRQAAPIERSLHNNGLETSLYEHYDILYVQDLFPSLAQSQPNLAGHLGRMNFQRRKAMAYREAHMNSLQSSSGKFIATRAISPEIRVELATNLKSIEDVQTHVTPETKATTYRKKDDQSINLAQLLEPTVMTADSVTSRASTYTTSQTQVKVPPPPIAGGLNGIGFICPYCCLLVVVQSKHQWRKHVFNDLQPYVCTFDGCSMNRHFFSSKDEWLNHEGLYHEGTWSCNTVGHIEYLTQADFLQHMKDSHSTTITIEQLSSTSDLFRRSCRTFAGTCHFCGHESSHIKHHIASHLERIALFALPRLETTSGSNYADHDTTERDEDSDLTGSISQHDLEHNLSAESSDLRDDAHTQEYLSMPALQSLHPPGPPPIKDPTSGSFKSREHTPPKVPEGWIIVWSSEYDEWFYIDSFTKTSQWDEPTELAAQDDVVPNWDEYTMKFVLARNGKSEAPPITFQPPTISETHTIAESTMASREDVSNDQADRSRDGNNDDTWQSDLRFKPSHVWSLDTSDGLSIALLSWNPVTKYARPVKLLFVPGLMMDEKIFSLDTIPESAISYFRKCGYHCFCVVPRIGKCEHAKDGWTIYDARLDVVAAINKIVDLNSIQEPNTPSEKIYIIAHCAGSLALSAGLLNGDIDASKIAGITASQTFMTPSFATQNRRKASLPLVTNMYKWISGTEWFDCSSSTADTYFQSALNQLLRFYPVSSSEVCSSVTCHRISAILGLPWSHQHVNERTHSCVDEFFGGMNMRTYVHWRDMNLRGCVLRSDNSDDLITPVNLRRLWGIPILQVGGMENAVYDPDNTMKSYDMLRELLDGSNYSRQIFGDYGHHDLWMSPKSAKDIFPVLENHIELVFRRMIEETLYSGKPDDRLPAYTKIQGSGHKARSI